MAHTEHTVMVVGASGLVGTAAVERFLADGAEVIAVSRRAPEVTPSPRLRHLPLDLRDADACRAAAPSFAEVTHVVYAAVYEMPGLVPGWTDPHQMSVNLQMLTNVLDAVAASPVRHLSLLQGTKAYGAHLHPIRVPARESEPRDAHENFYWLHEDLVRERSAREGWSFTIWRPQLIVGPNHGVVMNIPPVIGAYAAIRRAEGLPFSFPGGAPWVWEAVDTRLIADAMSWAANEPAAANETFNITNGEVFEFRDMWPALARTLGVEVGPDEPLSIAEYLPPRAEVWDRIVREHDLRPVALPELLGESHHYADVCFAFGAEAAPPPTYLSTVKLKQAGFGGAYDTEASFCHWLQVLIDRRILPPPNS
ncbi:MAG: NAD-dependent epimerase/dehydratase family protein [Ilumatobacteraceae bacterium]